VVQPTFSSQRSTAAQPIARHVPVVSYARQIDGVDGDSVRWFDDVLKPNERKLTVAGVRVRETHAEVTFYETARIYRLPHGNAGSARTLQLLQKAISSRTPVVVEFVEPNGAVIAAVREA
jgi:hypothetical protein